MSLRTMYIVIQQTKQLTGEKFPAIIMSQLTLCANNKMCVNVNNFIEIVKKDSN